MTTTRALLHGSALAAFLLMLGCQSDTSPPAGEQVTRAVRTVGAGEGGAESFGREAKNLLQNGGLEEWPNGDTALPGGWRVVETETETQVGRATGKGEVHDGKSALRITSEAHVVSVTTGPSITDENNTIL